MCITGFMDFHGVLQTEPRGAVANPGLGVIMSPIGAGASEMLLHNTAEEKGSEDEAVDFRPQSVPVSVLLLGSS